MVSEPVGQIRMAMPRDESYGKEKTNRKSGTDGDGGSLLDLFVVFFGVCICLFEICWGDLIDQGSHGLLGLIGNFKDANKIRD